VLSVGCKVFGARCLVFGVWYLEAGIQCLGDENGKGRDRRICGRQGVSGSPTARAEKGWSAPVAALVEKATWLLVAGAVGGFRLTPPCRVKT
jgi:hypothetical protein